MKTAIVFALVTAGAVLLYWLRVLPFREKKTNEPEQTAHAELVARRVETGTHGSGRSQGMGYSFILTFRMDDGTEKELFAYDHEYGTLREGMKGSLTRKGPYYVNFKPDAV